MYVRSKSEQRSPTSLATSHVFTLPHYHVSGQSDLQITTPNTILRRVLKTRDV